MSRHVDASLEARDVSSLSKLTNIKVHRHEQAPAVPAAQLAVPDKPSHTSSVEERRHHARYEAEGDKSELPSTSKVVFQGGLGRTSAASTENREQSEHLRDGFLISDGQKPPNNGRSHAKSLWSQAYAKLDKKLVDEYEELLRKELPTRGAHRKRAKCFHGLFSVQVPAYRRATHTTRVTTARVILSTRYPQIPRSVKHSWTR